MFDLIAATDIRSVVNFSLISVGMGGLAALATGRALAATWRPLWHVPVYMLGMAAVVRFCHFALFEDTLLDLGGYLSDVAVLLASALLGYRQVRVRQMVNQYAWLYEGNGPFSWRPRRGIR